MLAKPARRASKMGFQVGTQALRSLDYESVFWLGMELLQESSLKLKTGETEEQRILRIAHNMYMKFNRSTRSSSNLHVGLSCRFSSSKPTAIYT